MTSPNKFQMDRNPI